MGSKLEPTKIIELHESSSTETPSELNLFPKKNNPSITVLRTPEFKVTAVPIKHSITCYGYIVQEVDHPGQ